MGILIKNVRVSGYRALENIEVTLTQTTVLTGMNNVGKTSFLQALQLAFGNRVSVTQDDFFIRDNKAVKTIYIDMLIIPLDENNKECDNFSESWEVLFTRTRIHQSPTGKSSILLRTIIEFDDINNSYKRQQFILKEWPEFKSSDINWFDVENGNKMSFYFDELPFFYMNAQRDIIEDTKVRNSYLGKMLAKIEYSPEDIEIIEEQIEQLNEKTVNSSDILSEIKAALQELDTAMDTRSKGIEITPFTKKIRDLSKGLSIYYADRQDSFSMEYHGMGTRSWSSLLTLKSFIALLSKNAQREKLPFFPVLAIEEPEAHLHPNAQKKLFGQLDSIAGQKIISTHSTYIAATAKLSDLRSFYKDESVVCGQLDTENLEPEDKRKIKRHVINTRGEVFFSRLLVLFEGETEEQALPMFAEKYFGKTPVEMGINFVGVGGYGGYLPFLRFARAFNIPWLIFSDAEKKAKNSIKSQLKKFVFFANRNDFEKQLIDDGFDDEIKQAIMLLTPYENAQHKEGKEKEISKYDNEKLYKIISNKKTMYAPAIAEIIIKSTKPLPPKVIELFQKVHEILDLPEEKHGK